jgi:FkbH-like protein
LDKPDTAVRDLLTPPFDAAALFRARRKVRKALEPHAGRRIRMRVLSGSTVGELKDLIPLFLLQFGIKAEIVVGEYGAYFEEAVYPEATAADAVEADWIYVHTNSRNLLGIPAASDDPERLEEKRKIDLGRMRALIGALSRSGAKVIVNNFEGLPWRTLGNLSARDPRGCVRYINELNTELYSLLDGWENLFLNDIAYQSAVVGFEKWHNREYWDAFRYGVGPDALPQLAASIASIVAAADGAAKKALVSDLDNTLWGGVIGDDGVEGLVLGPETSKGSAFQDLQQYLKSLGARGVALAINSKNDRSLAESGFSHDASRLSLEDFAAFFANWDPKPQNITRIADTLNLGADSFCFIDDNPAEIEHVRQEMPAVLALGYRSSPNELMEQIERLGLFETVRLSSEDLERSGSYAGNRKRAEFKESVGDMESYLTSLGMVSEIGWVGKTGFDRAVQLINKTNQFNPTTRRTTPREMTNRLASDKDLVLQARLTDRFGDSGLVSIMAASLNGEAVEIDTWVMSCRVFNRGLEYAIFEWFLARATELNIYQIRAQFVPTPKNGYVADLYDRLGFERIADNIEGREYRFALRGNDTAQRPAHFIEVKNATY